MLRKVNGKPKKTQYFSITSENTALVTGAPFHPKVFLKSCRLRWVNKLRPNLKNGCKFSADEERTVIELQSEFGNKWARIVTGRTDNDVKNIWSSRQKTTRSDSP